MKFANNILIGRYIPGNSFFHNLDARSKIIFIFLYIIIVFLANSLIEYTILITVLITCLIFSNIKISFLIKGIIPVLWIIILTMILHLLFTDEGKIIFQWSIIKIYSFGIEQAIFISLRIIFLVLAASFLTLTTSSIDLAMGLEKLLTPLKYLKIPINEIALMMTISIRFIPILFEEMNKIVKAQIARGANINTGQLSRRIESIISIIIPLFINTFKRADELVIAMEARCFRGGRGRTRLKNLVFTWKDYSFISITVLAFILMLKL